VIGLTAGSVTVWLLVRAAMDPVLAVGLPLGPVAFTWATLRAPERPRFRVGVIPAAVGTVVLFIPMTLLALGTTTDSSSGGWMADTSPIGDAPSATGVESMVSVDWDLLYGGPGAATVAFGEAATAVASEFPTLRLEVWPAQDINGIVRFGAAPLVSVAAATEPITTLRYSLPELRDPVTTATFVVGVGPAGRRVVFEANLDLARTPPWTGTLAEWWTGSSPSQ
jgi:hypothetical protein